MDDPHDSMMERAHSAAEWRRRVDEDPSLALDEPATDHTPRGWSRTMGTIMGAVLILCITIAAITLSN